MSLDFSRSLFIDRLIPQYIREEYPLFLSFVKEYYNYLDRKNGELIAVIVKNPGKNYSGSTTATLEIIDNNVQSETYGEYIPDYKGATLVPYIVNGRIEKVRVTNYGSNYKKEDLTRGVISDSTGSGGEIKLVFADSIGGISKSSKQVSIARDIDSEISVLIEFLRNEYIPKLPKTLYSSDVASVEVTKFVKFIRQFYNSVGIEDSVKFLYRILFNADVNFYYPKVDMLRVSDGRWQVDNILRIYPGYSDIATFRENYVGHRLLIKGATGVATAILEDAEYIGSTGPHTKLFLSTINGNLNPLGGDTVCDYPITGAGGVLGQTYVDGSTGAFWTGNGHYIGTNGQLDSNKFIQGSPNIPYGASGVLPYYYQDFSYVLQSEESISQFKGLLEEIIHPAGLKYFIQLNILRIVSSGVTSAESLVDSFIGEAGSDYSFVSSLIPGYSSLGPNYSDIDKGKGSINPIPYLDFSGTSHVTLSVPNNTLDISDSTYSTFITNPDEFTNYSVIITDGPNVFYRYVTSYDTVSGNLTLDSSFTPTYSSNSIVDYRIIQNYRFNSVGPNYIQLSSLDPLRSGSTGPFNPVAISKLAAAISSSSGATGFDLLPSDNFNVKVGDTLRIDSEDILVNWIVGATGVWNISATRGENSTTISSHSAGATAYNKTSHDLVGWRIYVTSGPGSGQFSKVTAIGATGILTFSGSYTINPPGATGPDSTSTYWLLPDFGGSNNDGYYTTGATGISEIVISQPGVGYTQGGTGIYVSVQIDPPPYGTPATATATVGATGAITSINIINYGSGYVFTPTVTLTQIGATSPFSSGYAYANIQNSNSPYSQIADYSEWRGIILKIPDATNKFVTAVASANLDNVTGSTVASCTINNSGAGYIKPPVVSFKKGGGSGAAGRATLTGNVISGIVMDNLGNNYTYAPIVTIGESIIETGEYIYQSGTGGRGKVDYWDKTLNLLYIYKDPFSADFDTTQINYNGINILVDSIVGYYKTSGKPINVLSEAEISII